MTHNLVRASLRAYLQRLQESGLDGIPCSLTSETRAVAPAAERDDSATDDAPAMPRELPHQVEPAKVLSADGVTSPVEPPQAAGPSPNESLEEIRIDLGDCRRCKLGATRTNLVFGVGNPRARLVFAGEGPGRDEDMQGEPFVGEAGQVLNRIITAMGLNREDVYICNVVKCRPPGNRDPEPDEIAACSTFLLRQLRAINPEVIVALGKFASQTLLSTREPISRLRGTFGDFHGIPLMPTFHPSYLLRNRGNAAPFWEVWDDMTQVLRLLKLPVPEKSRKR